MLRATMVLLMLATLAGAGPAAAKKKKKPVAPPPETPTEVSPVASAGTPPTKDEGAPSGARSGASGFQLSARGMYVDGWTAGGQMGFAVEPRVVLGVHLDYNVRHQHEAMRYWCLATDDPACLRGPTLLGAFVRVHPFGGTIFDPYVELGLAHAWRHHQWPERPMRSDLAVPVFVGADVRLGSISIAPFGGVVWMPTYESDGAHKGPKRVFNLAAGLRLTLSL